MTLTRHILPLFVLVSLTQARDFDNDSIRVAVNDWLEDAQAATIKYGAPIENWETWRVTDMSRLFQGAATFTADLNAWDTSSVTDMHHMFAGCEVFDSPLDNWNVELVTDFSHMFYGASIFTGTSLGTWKTSSAQTMEQMFLRAYDFIGPQNLEDWDVGSVSTMYAMFFQAESFNRPVNKWDMTKVQYTNSLFEGASSFTQHICWPSMHPRAKCFQCFCGTSDATFDKEAGCPARVHPSIQAYSQACDADDILEEVVESQVFGRPDDADFRGGLDATSSFPEGVAGLPSLGGLSDPKVEGNTAGNGMTSTSNTTPKDSDLEVTDRENGPSDEFIIAESQREVAAAFSWQSSGMVSLLALLASMTRFR